MHQLKGCAYVYISLIGSLQEPQHVKGCDGG